MLNIFRRLDADNFQTVLIERKEDIWPSLQGVPREDRARREQPTLTRCVPDYTLDGPRVLGRPHPRARSRSSASTATRRSSRSATTTQMLGYMAYSGMPSHYPHWSYGKSYEKLKTLYDHGVSGLPVRDGHQLEPGARLPDAGQLALPADPHHRARLRPQRLLQEQLHLQVDARRVHDQHLQGARRSRAALRRRSRASASRQVEPFLDAAHALVAPVPAQPRRAEAVRRGGARSGSSRPQHPRPDPFQRIHRRGEHVEPDLRSVPLVARRGPAPLHPRSQPVPRRVGDATSSPSSTRRRSTSSRRSRPRS